MADYTHDFGEVNMKVKKVVRPAKAETEHYVDNKRLYTALLKYKIACREAAEQGKPKPRIPEYVGECILRIANGLAVKQNFVNYQFKEDMIGDGIENTIMYLDNFNPEKYKNPFAYFTQIIYYAFLRRIYKEKKALYVKQKALQNAALFGLLEQTQAGDDGLGESVIDLDNEYMSNLVEDFEKKLVEKKKKSKKLEEEILNEVGDSD